MEYLTVYLHCNQSKEPVLFLINLTSTVTAHHSCVCVWLSKDWVNKPPQPLHSRPIYHCRRVVHPASYLEIPKQFRFPPLHPVGICNDNVCVILPVTWLSREIENPTRERENGNIFLGMIETAEIRTEIYETIEKIFQI